jgi:hypothetical protein
VHKGLSQRCVLGLSSSIKNFHLQRFPININCRLVRLLNCGIILNNRISGYHNNLTYLLNPATNNKSIGNCRFSYEKRQLAEVEARPRGVKERSRFIHTNTPNTHHDYLQRSRHFLFSPRLYMPRFSAASCVWKCVS